MQTSEATHDDSVDVRSTKEKHQGCGCQSTAPHPETFSESEAAPFDATAAGFGPDGAEIDDEPTITRALATMRLSNGATIEFTAVEEEGGDFGIALRELGDARRRMPSVLSQMGKMSALEIYSKLSPEAPVPRLLVAQAKGEASGTLVDALEEPLEVDLDKLGSQTAVRCGSDSDGGYGGRFCVRGDGWHDFKGFACDGAVYPANTWFWCDPNAAYHWRDRWTDGHWRKHSVGITATCGGPAQVSHYYKKWINGKWSHRKTWPVPQSYWAWTRYDGCAKRDRWVKHRSWIQGQPSFVRSATFIYT